MELFIRKYLTRHYELSTTEEASKKLRLIVTYGIYHRDDNSKSKREIFNTDLLKELTTIFGVKEAKAKGYVNNWAKSINRKVDLKAYWEKLASLLPIAMRIAAQTIGLDLVSVQPLDAPMASLVYLDYIYSGNTPNINGRVYTEEVMEQAVNRFNDLTEKQGRQSFGQIMESAGNDRAEKIKRLWENQQIYGISSRRKDD